MGEKRKRSESLSEREEGEADFIEGFWTLVILPNRSVKELGEENVAKATDGQLFKAWKKDHLAIARDKLFRHDSIPMTDTSDNPILARFLKDLPRVKTSKPDRAYGLAKSAFTEKERVINDIMAYLSKVSSQMFHAFFIVEFKSITYLIAEARLQACRGGTVMINVMRKLKTKAGISNDNDQLDAGSFVFSIAMVPGQVELYVHCAEPPTPPSKAVNFHMHKLNTYSLDKGPDLAELRHDVNNVLDWGVVERRNYIKGLLPLIAEQDPGIQRKIKEQQEQLPLVALSEDEDELQSL